jgi:type VI secretion system protein ImpF
MEVRVTQNVRVRQSLLDRLLAPPEAAVSGLLLTHDVHHLRDAVARDLEYLLNARCAMDFEHHSIGPHTARSVACFGIRDFAGRVMHCAEDRRFISRSLAHSIEVHEPRLKQVVVDFHDEQSLVGSLIFTIRAVLLVRPAKEAVSFDAVLQPSMSRYRVTRARFAA